MYMRVEVFLPQVKYAMDSIRLPQAKLKEAISRNAGGYTVTEGYGCWRNPAGCTIYEGVQVLLFLMPDTPDTRLRLETVLREYHDATDEECTMYFINSNNPYYITKE